MDAWRMWIAKFKCCWMGTQVMDIIIPASCREDLEVIPVLSHGGTTEDDGQWVWFRSWKRLEKPSRESPGLRKLATTRNYVPTIDDVGSYLVVECTMAPSERRKGKIILKCADYPVGPAPPVVRNVKISEVGRNMFKGYGSYHGGLEGKSRWSWYRKSPNDNLMVIEGATNRDYEARHEDYGCQILFGYTPVRTDGIAGELVLSEPSPFIYPDLPVVESFTIIGKAMEGEILTAVDMPPTDEIRLSIWERYKKDIKYQWYRSGEGNGGKFSEIRQQRSCTYKVKLEDVGCYLRCECIVSDVFDRTAPPVYARSQCVVAGTPQIENLRLEGKGFHTSIFQVKGGYSGGVEGPSTVQWFRRMQSHEDLLLIPGQNGKTYESMPDDVGYTLVAEYTPVRDDGVVGEPVTASTDPIAVDPEVARDVKWIIDLGAAKFEAIRQVQESRPAFTCVPLYWNSNGPQRFSSKTVTQGPGAAVHEKRVVDVNRKRLKVVRPGGKTSFSTTEIKGTYAPPFRVDIFRNDPTRLRIVVDNDNEVELVVQSRHLRDVIALTIRGFAQRYNSSRT
eukprot:TRINITY_DN14979_c0_g1_i1.p1 TRINITY_DN14979_c0_g1~~TRINITY_DN14979_c0_g1_i1.p1  ORF type:complete len:562 (+),score=91.22 TRINITY_DN14979_c0_g1_i1:208-1893(+)